MIPFVKFTLAWLCFVLINPYVLGTSAKYFDLSYIATETTVKPLKMNVTQGANENGTWYQTESMDSVGTHLDAPCQFVKDAWCVDQIPFHQLVGRPTAVVDIRHKVFSGDTIIDRNAQLLTKDLETWERQYGRIPDGAVVLVRTGFSRYFNDDSMYHGTSANQSFPGVSDIAAKWLIESRYIFGVGIDTVSVDNGNGKGQTHAILAQKNIYILENISPVLNDLPPTGAILSVAVIRKGEGVSVTLASVMALVTATGNVSTDNLSDLLVDMEATSEASQVNRNNTQNSSSSVVSILQLVIVALIASLNRY